MKYRLKIDLETTALEIKTNSTLGSGDKADVNFYSKAKGDLAGGFYIIFTATPQYQLLRCSPSPRNFPTRLPTAAQKVWRIVLTTTSGPRIRMLCNGEEVLNIRLSDTVCSDKNWKKNWEKSVANIDFHPLDTLSDFYRAILIEGDR